MRISAPTEPVLGAGARGAGGARLPPGGPAGRAAEAGRSRRLRARRFLLDHQPPDAGAAARPLDRGRAPADGRRHRGRGGARRLPQAARRRAPATRVVCGVAGIRVMPEFQERDRHGFAFMTNEISSERRVEVGVARIAAMMREVKDGGGRIAVVAGPVVVHTGGSAALPGADSRRVTSTSCSPGTRSPSTTSSRRCSARRSASISTPARRSRAAIATTCGPSTRSAAPAG